MNIDLSPIISQFIDCKSSIPVSYMELEKTVKGIINKACDSLHDGQYVEVNLGVIGKINYPYYSYKTLTSLDLLSIEDLFLFSRYYLEKEKNRIFIDIGSNIGLHTIIAKLIGFKVLSFEPDPETFGINKKFLLQNKINFLEIEKFNAENLTENFNVSDVVLVNSAVSNFIGTSTFNRFLDNPTGNHLDGRKRNIYGDVSEVVVNVASLSKIQADAIIKVDAEGEDAQILESILNGDKLSGKCYLCDWREETRETIFNHLVSYKLSSFNPFLNKQVFSLNDLPKEKSADFVCIDLSAGRK